MRFKSRIDSFFIILFGILISFCIWIGWMDINSSDEWGKYAGSAVMLLLIGLISWFSFTCHYLITGKKMIYKWGLFKGEIEIQSITRIEKNTILWTGNRPATAFRGLVVSYAKLNKVYLSPENEDLFIKELLKLNPDIKLM